uniref:Uncharacterized protein n=1 Tax=Sus scrofa TaxID=9823 RepID=A0A8D1MDJ5_PIG
MWATHKQAVCCIVFNSMYKHSCLSVYAEAWLWYWSKCLPYEKVSVRFQIKEFPCSTVG